MMSMMMMMVAIADICLVESNEGELVKGDR